MPRLLSSMNIDVVVSSVALSIAILGSLIVGCSPTDSLSDPARSNASSIPLEKTTALEKVTAGPVPKKTLRLSSLQPARVDPYEQAPILSKISGYVESVTVDLGDKVRKGDPLILLKAPEYLDLVVTKQGLVDQAHAQIKQSQAALIADQAAVNSASAKLQQAQASIERANALIARWESESARTSELADKGVVTKQLAEETLNQYQSALAGKKEIASLIESEQANLLEAESQVGKAQADLEAANAKLAVAKSELAQAVTMAGYLNLVAPFDGVITSRNVDAGHYVQPAGSSDDRPLLTITNSSRVRINVDIPENEAGFVTSGAAGDAVEILIPSNGSKSILGQVTRSSSSLDPQSRCLPIQVELDNTEHHLLSGAFVQVRVLLEERKDVLALPLGAIVKKTDETYCCLVSDGKIAFQPIKLGMKVGDDVEILSGLDGSETVVLARAATLKTGQSIEVLVKK